MSSKSISPSVTDSWHFAASISNISAFLAQDLPENTIIATILPAAAALLPHLALRLDAYGWQLMAGAPGQLFSGCRSGSTLDMWTAAEAMEDLAVFLGQWMNVLKTHPYHLSYANEESLKADLERVAKFLRTILVLLPEIWKGSLGVEPLIRRSSLRGGGDDENPPELMADPAVDHEAERQHEAVEALNKTISPPRWMQHRPTVPAVSQTAGDDVQPTDVVEHHAAIHQRPRRYSDDSDVSNLVLEPRPTQEIPLANFLQVPNRRDSATPPPLDNLPAASIFAEPSGSYTPHDLRPTQHNESHVPHILDGPRHTSRCGIDDDEAFNQHCLQRGQWLIDSPSDPHTTVQIGHGEQGVSFRCFEATFLNFPGVDTIKIVHPLCALELRSLDWDALRAVGFHLRRYVGRRAVSLMNRNQVVRNAEKASLDMVQRELGSRSWERRRATDAQSDFDRMWAASGMPRDDRPPIPLLCDDGPEFMEAPVPTIIVSTPTPPAIPTPPTRLRAPDFNTRVSRSRVRRESEGEARIGRTSIRGRREGDSYPPGTDTYPAFNCRGEYMGQYPIAEQNPAPLRSFRRRQSVGVPTESELGLDYGCIGRSREDLSHDGSDGDDESAF